MKSGGTPEALVLALVLVGSVGEPLPAEAQSVNPVRMDPAEQEPPAETVESAGSYRVDPAVFVTAIVESVTSEKTVAVPRSTVDAYCGDDDGCTLRLVTVVDAPADPGPIHSDTRWFGIRGSGEWKAFARPPGGTVVLVLGNIVTNPHETVFADAGCQLRDDNGTNSLGFPFQRLEVVAAGSSSEPFHCLLRIDD